MAGCDQEGFGENWKKWHTPGKAHHRCLGCCKAGNKTEKGRIASWNSEPLYVVSLKGNHMEFISHDAEKVAIQKYLGTRSRRR